MKLKKASISILVNSEYTTIEITDETASRMFVRVTLTPEQLSKALSRLMSTPCEAEVMENALPVLNMKLEVKKLEFEIPKKLWREHRNETSEKLLAEIAHQKAPKGWTPDIRFSSQDSFFIKGEKNYARCTIRRWVEE